MRRWRQRRRWWRQRRRRQWRRQQRQRWHRRQRRRRRRRWQRQGRRRQRQRPQRRQRRRRRWRLQHNNQLKAAIVTGRERTRGGGRGHGQRRPWFINVLVSFFDLAFCEECGLGTTQSVQKSFFSRQKSSAPFLTCIIISFGHCLPFALPSLERCVCHTNSGITT